MADAVNDDLWDVGNIASEKERSKTIDFSDPYVNIDANFIFRSKNNFKDFAKRQLRIITKDASQGYVPFEFNEAQTKIHKAIEKQIKEKGRVRALVLKARQQGISTYTAGRVFWKTFYTPHTRSVVIAHDSATSDALFTMSKNFIDRMSKDFKPELIRSNAKEVKFSHNDSGFRLYTAWSP